MECKDRLTALQISDCFQVLIETLWNVKGDKFKYHIEDGVLIETLWNVKKKTPKKPTDHQKVLIETLWNVKMVYRNIYNRIEMY